MHVAPLRIGGGIVAVSIKHPKNELNDTGTPLARATIGTVCTVM